MVERDVQLIGLRLTFHRVYNNRFVSARCCVALLLRVLRSKVATHERDYSVHLKMATQVSE